MSVTEKLQHFVEALPADRKVKGTFQFTVDETVVALDTTVDPPMIRDGKFQQAPDDPSADVEARMPLAVFEALCVPDASSSSDFLLWLGHAFWTGELVVKGSQPKFIEFWCLVS